MPAGAAGCDSTASCLRAIAEAQRETRSIEARFRQVKHLALLDEPLVSSGRFLFLAPDRVRLEMRQPEPATIVIRGAEIHVPGVAEADRRALAMSPMAAMLRQLGAIFAGSVEGLQESFEVSAAAAGAGVRLVLAPRSGEWAENVSRLELTFAGPHLLPSEIRIEDALGDRLEVSMHDVQRNVELAADLFEPPAAGGVDRAGGDRDGGASPADP